MHDSTAYIGHHHKRCVGIAVYHQGDVWSLGCALFKWTTGKEFAYVAAGARLQDTLYLVPPSWGDKASPPTPSLYAT